jgi:flagellar protein FlgJ
MTLDVARVTSPIDPRGLDAVRRDVRSGDGSPDTIRAVAKQFESLFAQMLIKSMRATSFGDGLMDSEQSDFYRDVFDQQLSVELTKGQGLGLADMLFRQLSGVEPPAATTAAACPTASDAAAATAATAPSAWSCASREDFVRQVWPHAEAAGRALGVDPATIVSHAALETGWGRSLPVTADGRPSFNLFGIKAGQRWGSAAADSMTTEYRQGVATRGVESFRAYDSLGAGMADYARLLGGSPRYAAALNTGNDVAAFAGALQKAGYATDPAYARKLQSVAAQVQALRGSAESLKVADLPTITRTTRTAT